MNLLISFSGGETSAFMTRLILRHDDLPYNYDRIVVVFANTGEENEETLEFVHRCDMEFGFQTTWVESVIDPRPRRGTRHRVVTFDTASRRGEPYEAVIQKHGIPNKAFPHCTRELKRYPIEDYAKRVLGWGTSDYETAIGIRLDEARRASSDRRLVYPLIHWFPSDKQDVNIFWEAQPFRLKLRDYEGNCKWCWKKSDAKLLRILAERPDVFDFPERMEASYPYVGAEFKKHGATRARTFFRGNRSVADLKRMAALIGTQPVPDAGDGDAGCGESCEPYPTDDDHTSVLLPAPKASE